MTLTVVPAFPRRVRARRAVPFDFAPAREGAFEGYASLFGVADQSRDVMARGAFRATLARRGAAGLRMLYQHAAGEPIGVWTHAAEDARGLFVRGRLTLDSSRAREVHALMKDGALNGLSVGFRVLRARKDPKTGLRALLEVDLWEISVVTFPMLDDARVTAVKADAPLAPARVRRAAALFHVPPKET